ncbi:helix-turn-helix transcriptional regulator [Streptacidiphilus neutrinimicus]|uniref:helix-turn-helix transcriptional regulator n=1 Tax=Streptacidiphilus neutrinimicus TaxID=105420 RepID=UPI0009FD59B0|nr:helix-turn-helix domain-containing protein [Streptacidiphilus neutrinimicus]
MDLAPAPTGWTFLTNHARVLVQIARDPGIRVRDIARHCLLTERAVMRIIADLEEAGYLTHTRAGRSNHYRVLPGTELRHPADAGPKVADLLAVLTAAPDGPAAAAKQGQRGRQEGQQGARA